MELSTTAFPFRKLKYMKYLVLEVMMYVDSLQLLEYMFYVNNETRGFLRKHIVTIENGFINEGLVVYEINDNFESY